MPHVELQLDEPACQPDANLAFTFLRLVSGWSLARLAIDPIQWRARAGYDSILIHHSTSNLIAVSQLQAKTYSFHFALMHVFFAIYTYIEYLV